MNTIAVERGAYLRRLWGHGIFGKIFGLAWAVYGFFAFTRDESKQVQESVGDHPMIDWALSIPGHWWVLGALLIALLWLFESSFRENHAARDEIDALKLRLFNRAKRQAAMDKLWTLRAAGIEIRNEDVSAADFPEWHARWHKWRDQVWAAADEVNPNLKNWLEYLDQCRPPPARDTYQGGADHIKLVRVGSEILLRLQEFLEREIV